MELGQEQGERARQVDLSNDRGIRFGAQCQICSARYATPLQPLTVDFTDRELREAKDEVRATFAAAWHELEIECYYCHRRACPLCWDADNRMCAACVAERNRTRSPFRGVGASGPLADGRLQVVETGRFSDVARPAWLGDLLGASQTGGPARGSPAAHGDGAQPWAPEAIPTAGDLARDALADAPFLPGSSNTIAAAQTMHMPAPAMDGPLPIWQQPTRRDLGGETAVHIPSQEGATTSTMVECPRCGTENYDFVTRCTVCQLQLIQICPLCEKLNPGQATRCEACGSPLNRPRGWSGVVNQQRITATSLAADEDRWGEAQAARIREEAFRGGPPATGAGGDQAWAPAGYAPRGATAPPIPAAWQVNRQTGAPLLMPAPTVIPLARRTGAPAEFQDPYAPVAVAATTDRQPFASALSERIISLTLMVLIAAILGAVVAAELSPQANDAVRAVTHLDIRQVIAQFIHQIDLMTHRNSNGH